MEIKQQGLLAQVPLQERSFSQLQGANASILT